MELFGSVGNTVLYRRGSLWLSTRGVARALRDVRGFSVRFQTQGNWDMVGNNFLRNRAGRWGWDLDVCKTGHAAGL
jgi:catalase